MFQLFPYDEYENRWRKLKDGMSRLGVDGVILTAIDSLDYFTGHATYAWRGSLIAMVMSVAANQPTLIIPLNELGNAETTTWIKDIRTYGSFNPAEREKVDCIEFLLNVLKDLGLEHASIGIQIRGRPNLSLHDERKLLSRLETDNLISIDDLIASIRAIKSELEIEAIREAARITCEGYRAGIAIIKEGKTEQEVARTMWATMIDEGCDLPEDSGHIIVRGGPERNRCFGSVPQPNSLKTGDIVKIDGGCRYKRFWCDMSRFVSIGEPSKEQRMMYEADLAANHACITAIKPGKTAADVYEAGLSEIKQRGFGALAESRSDTIFGHSTGLLIHEPPIIKADSREVLQPGMVLSIEPQLAAYPPDFKVSVFSVEDVVLVTTTGAEILTSLDRSLYVAQ